MEIMKKFSIVLAASALLGIGSLVSNTRPTHASATTVSRQTRSLNEHYDCHHGIEYITFNHRKNRLTIYMKSQKHHKAHYYTGEPLPVTKQAEHAIKLGEHIKSADHDSGMVTYFKTGHMFQALNGELIKLFK